MGTHVITGDRNFIVESRGGGKTGGAHARIGSKNRAAKPERIHRLRGKQARVPTYQPPRAFGVTFRITPCFVLASTCLLPLVIESFPQLCFEQDEKLNAAGSFFSSLRHLYRPILILRINYEEEEGRLGY